jgi:Tfp pilus assembly protein PilX
MMKTKFSSTGPARRSLRVAQRGVTLIVGLIMMVLITLVVINAFTLSSSNLKTVGNVQVRSEATAAANQAIEQMISAGFTTALGPRTYSIDIDKNGTEDYSVAVATPTCLKSVVVDTCTNSGCEVDPTCSSSCQGGVCVGLLATSCGNSLTDWDIKAVVAHAATGASVTVREGVRIPLTTSAAASVCN